MNIRNIVKKILREATSDSGGRGSYVGPLQYGIRRFKDSQNGPFTIKVSKYDSPELAHDSYDGKMDTPKSKIKKIESEAKKITKYITDHPDLFTSDEEGNVINQLPGKNLKIVPIDEWVEITQDIIAEDLAVWFGKKKKPKGSKQPKGPWVDICRKVDGKHPPCGRKDADKGSYPKCRAAGVAGKMTDDEKRNACRQKRAVERKDTQTGKGQKPNWVSYKKK